MNTFEVQIATAFTLTEVLQFGRLLHGDLVEAEHNGDDLWNVVHLLADVGHSVWVPRLLTVSDQRRLDSLFHEAHLVLHRNPLATREESVSLITPGVANDLRSRVASAIYEGSDSGQYQSFSDLGLWEEVLREAAVDWSFRAIRTNFEVRGCAMCGRWFEPQLANRSRFCGTSCRKQFNNIRTSGRDHVKAFTCESCDRQLSMDLFSGLQNSHEDDAVTPLRIGRYMASLNNLRCVACVQAKNPEWARYISPIVDAKERSAGA
jgi:hypothetical protein